MGSNSNAIGPLKKVSLVFTTGSTSELKDQLASRSLWNLFMASAQEIIKSMAKAGGGCGDGCSCGCG